MEVALSLRDRKAACFMRRSSLTGVEEAVHVVWKFGCPVAERQGYLAASPPQPFAATVQLLSLATYHLREHVYSRGQALHGDIAGSIRAASDRQWFDIG